MLITVFSVGADRGESTFTLDVGADLQLADFKALCEAESGIPAKKIQVLLHGDREVTQDNAATLAQCGLSDGDIVVLREGATPRGAAPHPAGSGGPPPASSREGPGLPLIDFGSIVIPPHTSSRRRPHAASSSAAASSSQRPSQPPPTEPPPTPPPGGGGAGVAAAAGGGALHPLESDPRALREMLLSSPHDLALLKERNPPLADALLSGDLERFAAVLREQREERARRERERILLLNSDPFDIDAQARIAEDIRQQNVEENMSIAMEEAPESFGQVVMLYINCIVNGHPVKAFVDSGAQMTIMSQAAAERCNIMRLVDRRWAGIAKGVGTQRIIGRVHLGQIQIEQDFLPSSFSILEEQPMDMLLGLDMLKRHQCVIDLKRGVLVLGSSGTETRFLAESELPECARLHGDGDSTPPPLPASPPPGTSSGASAAAASSSSSSLAQRGSVTPEELADRELAEALQRSAQEAENQRQ